MPWVLALATAVLGLTTVLVTLSASLQLPPLERVAATNRLHGEAPWLIVRSPSGSWYLNGEPLSSSGLARRLRESEQKPRSLLLLPANGRRAAQVADDLRWLRQHSSHPVSLGLVPEHS